MCEVAQHSARIEYRPTAKVYLYLWESFIASVPLNLIALGFRQKNVAKKLHDDGLLLNVEPYLQYLPTSEKLLGAGML